jgi:UDP-2,4-diacetamido-2,4,6-trideoxy-beta-L-altropyranose hydrolase
VTRPSVPRASSSPRDDTVGVVSLRRAQEGDARRIFEWRNIPEIVARGSSQRRVDWDEHLAWFRRVTTDPDRLVLLIVEADEDIGQVRFETTDPGTARVSIYLVPGRTGRGVGVEALRQGCREAFSTLPVDCIEALIRDDNEGSVAAFARAGFRPSDRPVDAGHQLLVLDRPGDLAAPTKDAAE